MEEEEHQALRVGLAPQPPPAVRESQHVNKGNISLGTPGVPAGGGCPAQITTPGHGAMVLQVSPLGTWMEPGAEEGQPSNQGQRARGCGVPASEPSCALRNLRLRIVSSHSRAPSPSQLQTGPQKAGTVMYTSLLLGPKASPGRAFPGGGHCAAWRSGWFQPPP